MSVLKQTVITDSKQDVTVITDSKQGVKTTAKQHTVWNYNSPEESLV